MNREYAGAGARSLSDNGTEELAFFAHEFRNLVFTAMLAFGALERESAGVGGRSGNLLSKSLQEMNALVDRFLAEGGHRGGHLSF